MRRALVCFCDLTYIFSTNALQNGVDVKTVSSMLGHYDVRLTLRTCAHAVRQKQNEAGQTIVSILGNAV